MTKDLIIYMATHNKKCSHVACYDYIIPIQVGKALSNECIAEIDDNTGDNISEKNGTYCELTALYWMWKNDDADNIGLYHYRRRFDICRDKIVSVLENYDIILPRKKAFKMSIEQQYIKEHRKEDWDVLLNVLMEYSPEYYESIKEVFSSNKIYRFNMFISKKELFHKYCEWVFPIIKKIEEKIKCIERDAYQKRYIGFMAERLFTLYVFHNNFKTYEVDVLFEENKVRDEKLKNILNDFVFKIIR